MAPKSFLQSPDAIISSGIVSKKEILGSMVTGLNIHDQPELSTTHRRGGGGKCDVGRGKLRNRNPQSVPQLQIAMEHTQFKVH